jgi:hypothetical protein
MTHPLTLHLVTVRKNVKDNSGSLSQDYIEDWPEDPCLYETEDLELYRSASKLQIVGDTISRKPLRTASQAVQTHLKIWVVLLREDTQLLEQAYNNLYTRSEIELNLETPQDGV